MKLWSGFLPGFLDVWDSLRARGCNKSGEPLILGVARGELGEEGKVAWRGDLGALTARGDPPGLGAKCPWHGSAPTSKRFASFSDAVRFSVSGVPKCSLS